MTPKVRSPVHAELRSALRLAGGRVCTTVPCWDSGSLTTCSPVTCSVAWVHLCHKHGKDKPQIQMEPCQTRNRESSLEYVPGALKWTQQCLVLRKLEAQARALHGLLPGHPGRLLSWVQGPR